MAHECPECGMVCYCNGDIDDCCHNFRKYQRTCICCDDVDDDLEDLDYHCGECAGSGTDDSGQVCRSCNGSGWE